MLRWIVESSLKLRHLVSFVAAMLIVFDVTQFRGMPVDVYPEFAPPRAEIQVLALGMSAADVEALITVPMEEGLNGMEGLDVLRSRSVPDLSDLVLIFKPGTNMMDARLLVQERVRAVTTQLPVWATSPFMIQPLSSTSRVMKIGMSTKDKSTQTLIDTALTAYWTVRPRLMQPISRYRPPKRSISTPSGTTGGKPTKSHARSAPRPPVQSRTCLTRARRSGISAR